MVWPRLAVTRTNHPILPVVLPIKQWVTQGRGGYNLTLQKTHAISRAHRPQAENDTLQLALHAGSADGVGGKEARKGPGLGISCRTTYVSIQ